MKEEIINHETGILAKRAGFDWPTNAAYVDLREFRGKNELTEFATANNHNKKPHRVSIPTQSHLQRWLRDRHRINFSIEYDHYTTYYTINFEHVDRTGVFCSFYVDRDTSYESVLEKGLQYALKYLLKQSK